MNTVKKYLELMRIIRSNTLIHVVLDTNIYRHNPARDNADFHALARLAKKNILKLYIPYVVEREFQTQQRELCERELNKAKSALETLLRKELSDNIKAKIEAIKDEVNTESAAILEDTEQQIIHWATAINAVRIPLCLEQTKGAMEAYFQGKPPLKEPKKREDIPDSFIVQAITKIAQGNYSQVYVVANDRKVQEAFNNDDDIDTYASLSEFIKSDTIQNKLKDADIHESIDDIIDAVKRYDDHFREISSYIESNIGEKARKKTIEEDLYGGYELTIYSYEDAECLNVKFDNLSYYGDGQFGMPFTLNMEVYVEYYIQKSDYYASEVILSVSDINDHVFEVDEYFEIAVEGTVTFNVDIENLNLEDFEKCIDATSIEIDSIENIRLPKNHPFI